MSNHNQDAAQTYNKSLTPKDLFALRDSNPDDINFIYATWLKALFYGNPAYNAIDKDIYFENYRKVVCGLLGSSSVKVACLKDDPDVIIGYSVYSGKTLHFVFVKAIWRKIGVAKSLVPADIEQVSHLTTVGRSILNKYPKVKYNPFL